MSKEFALLTATRRFETYLSREYYHLEKMKANERVTDSLLETKVNHYNELVSIVNELFSGLTGSQSTLFDPYKLDESDEPDFGMIELETYQSTEDESMTTIHVDTDTGEVLPAPTSHKPVLEVPTAPVIPQWQADGYESYDEWVSDKEAESAETLNDLSIGVNPAMSKHRAEQALSEYEQTSDQDISSYDPEADVPVSVLPGVTAQDEADESEPEPVVEIVEDEAVEAGSVTEFEAAAPEDDTEDDKVSPDLYIESKGSSAEDFGEADPYDPEASNLRSTQDLRYLDRTPDNVQVNSDPIQIANVTTAVERDGDTPKAGAHIDLDSFLYKPRKNVESNLIEDDIKHLFTAEE